MAKDPPAIYCVGTRQARFAPLGRIVSAAKRFEMHDMLAEARRMEGRQEGCMYSVVVDVVNGRLVEVIPRAKRVFLNY